MSQSNKEAQIILTLQAYQADPILSLRQATIVYNITFSTLHTQHNSITTRFN
jgi:hypothetical protein